MDAAVPKVIAYSHCTRVYGKLVTCCDKIPLDNDTLKPPQEYLDAREALQPIIMADLKKALTREGRLERSERPVRGPPKWSAPDAPFGGAAGMRTWKTQHDNDWWNTHTYGRDYYWGPDQQHWRGPAWSVEPGGYRRSWQDVPESKTEVGTGTAKAAKAAKLAATAEQGERVTALIAREAECRAGANPSAAPASRGYGAYGAHRRARDAERRDAPRP